MLNDSWINIRTKPGILCCFEFPSTITRQNPSFLQSFCIQIKDYEKKVKLFYLLRWVSSSPPTALLVIVARQMQHTNTYTRFNICGCFVLCSWHDVIIRLTLCLVILIKKLTESLLHISTAKPLACLTYHIFCYHTWHIEESFWSSFFLGNSIKIFYYMHLCVCVY